MQTTLVSLMHSPIAWYVLSGIVLTVIDKWIPLTDAQWAKFLADKKTLGVIYNLLRQFGFNIPGIMRSLRVLFAGPPPYLQPPAPPASADNQPL